MRKQIPSLRQDIIVRKVEKNRIGKDGQKIMLKPGENILVSQKTFPKGIMYYVKNTKKRMISKYDTEASGYKNVINQLKVKIHNVSLKMKDY